ncbi:predicted protein [Francisella tularensis subsp. tularensis MA00-2987]|nr:predicted protein [Francisella tularensis subsp. tularensis MA00-2987]
MKIAFLVYLSSILQKIYSNLKLEHKYINI